VLEHLRLIWRDRFDRFFLGWNLQDFPVADVTQMRTGELSAASRAQTAWRFLLLLRVIESLSQDQGVRGSSAFDGVVRDLKNGGLLSSDWKSKVVRWSKTQAKIKLPVAELGVELTHDEVDTIRATDILSSVLQDVQTDSQHLIALDGLDQFFFEVEQEWRSLAGLTHAIASVNKLFRATGQRITVVAAIRSDIFDVLPSPESNKLKPHAVQLDWSTLGIGAANQLWEIVGAKAAVSRPAARDIVKTYLGQRIAVGPHTVMAEYFLDNTRLLPRDLIALLNILKTVHPGSAPVTEKEAKDTVTQYCDRYFQGEIFNNLAGIIREDGARKLAEFRDALRVLPTRLFTFDDVQGELNGSLDPHETKALLKQM
jgi:hypothetical protein